MVDTLIYLHILGLAIWLGSMVTWAMFAPKLSKLDPTKNTTNTLRVIFTKLSWSSYVVSLLSGITLYFLNESTTSNWYIEVSLLGLAGLIIFLHSYLPNLNSAVKGMINGGMLLVGLVVLYLAVSYI